MVLVLDKSSSIKPPHWNKMLQCCQTVLDALRGQPLRVAVVVFAKHAKILSDWTLDPEAALRPLHGAAPPSFASRVLGLQF
mgnify:FL=1